MSGREHEPVAAFFPSIDRNLIRDLDRHLRSAKPSPDPTFVPAAKLPPATPFMPPASPPQGAATQVTPPAQRSSSRPNIAGVLEAVENAAHAMAAMTARIEELESHLDTSETANRHLEARLSEADQINLDLDAKLKASIERAETSEMLAEQQAARVVDLERELSTVHSDLARVTEAITAALGLPHQ